MRRLSAAVVVVGLVACGTDDAIPFLGGAEVDTATGDSGADTTPEDTGADSEEDTRTDATPDVSPDADVVEDVSPDADVVEDVSPDADVVEDADVATDADAAADADVAQDADMGADADVREDVDPGDVPPRCGDGVVDEDEECDDGNDINTDECNNACRISYCGDGIVNATRGEITLEDPLVDAFGVEAYVCDDGASCSTGPSPTLCEVAENGSASEHGICQALGYDTAVDALWGGGPGAGISPMHHAFNWECSGYVCVESPFSDFEDDCSDFEMLAELTCDGIVGEQCDDGGDNADEPNACRTTCRLPACGDGITDDGEGCDDGDDNADEPDLCRVDCQLPACGDGIQDTGEGCDDGEGNADEPNACRTTCELPACTDGIVDTGEECDDGNDVEDDGCSNICRVPGCRDGVLQDGEECDDGNEIDDDGCSNECLLPQCGDGIVQEALDEECDDGDDDDFDGCSNDCVAASCGDGIIQSEGEGCSLLLINDRDAGVSALTALFAEQGIEYVSVDSSGASDLALMSEHAFVLFNHYNRAATSAEVDALNAYVESGGTLLITGYDTMGSPTDSALAGVARVTTSGDGPFRNNCAVTTEGHPITDGPFGSWPAGHAFTASSTDHDNVSAGGASIEIASVDSASKITFAEGIGAGGIVMYWNGNSGVGDWIAGGDMEALFLNLLGAYCVGLAEECDDGDLNSDEPGATCRTDCSLPACGDGVLDTELGEECDDGNFIEDDGCSNICRLPACGDGVVQLDEQCDDGNDVDTDDCRNDCSRQVCGDGFLADAEECDDGDLNSDEPDASCRTTCLFPTCGDAITDTGEECDDGNDVETDLCTSVCAAPACGDGFVQPDLGEECDDGNDVDTDDCRNDCTFHVCGDGFLADAEECDDGELNSGEPDATCRTDCLLPHCGDGVHDSGEECDDGNLSDRDFCSPLCTETFCGDGVRQAVRGEDCDDGDDDDDDECANDCTGEITGFASCSDVDLGSATGPAVSIGSTVGAGNDYEASCAASARAEDLSFNWVAPTDGAFSINTEGSRYDTALHIRVFPEEIVVDECFDSVQIACNDDSIFGLQSQIILEAEAGVEYLIIVDGFSTSTGDYILNINPM